MVTPERLFAWNDGKQNVGGAASPGVNHIGPGVVIRAVMRVGKAADAVARLDVEPDVMAFPEHHAGGPDFHVDANHFIGLQPLAIFMRVVGAIVQGERWVELAVRCAQPAFSDRNGLALLAPLEDVFAVRSNVAYRRENVHVFGGAGNPEHQHDGPGDLRILGQGRAVDVHEAEATPALLIALAGYEINEDLRGASFASAPSVSAPWPRATGSR